MQKGRVFAVSGQVTLGQNSGRLLTKDVIRLKNILLDKIYFNQYSQAVKRESQPVKAVGANGKINFVISGSAVQIRPWAPNIFTISNDFNI